MFGNLGFSEIMLILLVILLLFGAKRIPEIAGSFGKGIKEFKKNMNDIGNTDVASPPERDRLRSTDQTTSSRAADDARTEPKRLV